MTPNSPIGHEAEHAPRVLVTAASRYGATAGIAQAIGEALAKHGITVDVAPPEQVASIDDYDAVVLGSAVYTGHWLGTAKEFAARFSGALAIRPVWLFSSGPVGDPGKKMTQSMGQDPVDIGGIKVATHARGHRMFAGKLDRKNLRGVQRAGLLAFRSLQGDFRDWPAISQWAEDIAQQLPSLASR